MIKKFLIFLCVTAVLAEEDPILEFTKTIDGNCASENGVTYEEVGGMDETTDHSRNLKCYAKCVLEHNGILKDGTFQNEPALKVFDGVLDTSQAQAMATKCSQNVGDRDACDVSLEIFQCYDGELKTALA